MATITCGNCRKTHGSADEVRSCYMTCSFCGLEVTAGGWCGCDYGITAEVPADIPEWDEGPTCSICDGLGHGYPGGRPCPLEERDYSGEPAWAM